MKRCIVLIIILLTCFYQDTFAQTECQQNIKKATESYYDGNYDNCIQLLESSMRVCSFSKKDMERALELLTKAYLEEDNIEQADVCVKRLLKNNPHYELKEDQNTEDFNRLVKQYIVVPIFSLGAKNAIMHPNFKSTKTYSILNSVDYNAPYHFNSSNNWYLNYYGWMEYQPFNSVSFNAELIYYSVGYFRNLSNNTNDWYLNYSEGLTFIEIPFYAKKIFHFKNLLISLYGGLDWLYLVNSSATAFYDSIAAKKSLYRTGISTTAQRNKNNFEWLAGTSIGHRFKNLGIFLDIRYFGGITNLVNTSNRKSNTLLINDFNYIDNDFRFNKAFEIGLSLSYVLKYTAKKPPIHK